MPNGIESVSAVGDAGEPALILNRMDIIEPRTERLQLRQWLPGDRESLAAMSADPRVMEFFPATLGRSESDAIADTCQRLITDRGWGIWAVELLESGEFIGFVGLHIPRPDLPPSPCVEVLWRLAAPHWGRGYATEAAGAALKVGFEQLDLSEIVSFVVPVNHRSRAVMERLNMTDTGSGFEHPAVPESSPLREHCLYKITRESWLHHDASKVG